MHPPIGIDLGTTNSCLATLHNNIPITIPIDNNMTLPSVVHIKNDIATIGTKALKSLLTEPLDTFYATKRLIGNKYNSIKETYNYKLKSGKNNNILLENTENKTFCPTQISSFILKRIKLAADIYFGKKINKAVVTVPAYFNDNQRQATKNAMKIAGLETLRMINEPTAAALAYGLEKKGNGILVVYDLGGGTFDISILEIHNGVFEVKATGGNTKLGGEDMDTKIAKMLENKIKLAFQQKVDVSGENVLINNYSDFEKFLKPEFLRIKAEEIKKKLSENENVILNLENKEIKITKQEIENLIIPVINETIEICKKTLSDSKVKMNEIKEVILVGGATKMPLVHQKVAEFFNIQPKKDINPDEVVAQGAAAQAGILQGKIKNLLLDVCPISLGIETYGGLFSKIIERNSTIPIKSKNIFTTAFDNQSEVEIKI
ncbi:MAG: Hsp70 family protein, partial [Oscillospiraceae bacterium]